MGEEQSIYKETFVAIKSIYDYKLRRREIRRHQFNLVLVLAGVLSLALFTLYTYDNVKPWYFAGVLIVFLYSISIYHIFPKKLLRPWYLLEDYEKVAKGDIPLSEIYKRLVYEMYLLVHRQKDKFDKKERRDIIISIYLIVSIFSTLIITLSFSNFLYILYSFIGIVIFFGLLFLHLYKKFEEEINDEVKNFNLKVERYMNQNKKKKGKEPTNQEIIDKLKHLETGLKKSSHLALVAISFAIIAVAIPTFLDIMDTPEWGRGIFVILYFGIGFYILFEQVYKIKNLSK